MADPIKLIRSNNPFDYRDCTTVDLPYRRQRVKNLKRRFMPDVEHVQIRVNGCELDRQQIRRRRLQPGDEVIMAPLPGDAALWATALWITGDAAASYTWLTVATYAALSVGVTIGMSYLIRSLGPKPDTFDPVSTQPTYSWSPHTVQGQGLSVPRGYGRLRKYGNLIAAWTEVASDKEEIDLELSFGSGPCEGVVANTWEINDRDSSNFSGITTYERKGLMTQTAIFAARKLEYRPEQEVTNSGGAYTWTTPSDDFDKIEITLGHHGHAYKNNGKQATSQTNVKIEISEKDAASWGTLFDGLLTNSTTQKRVTYVNTGTYTGGSAQTISKGTQYDIKITKVTTDSATSQVLNKVAVVAIREVITVAFQDPGIAKIGVSALASEEFSGRLNVSVIHEGRIVNTYNGSSWTLQYSKNPAWVMWDILTRPVIDGDGGGTPWSIDRYDGIDPARLTPFLANWYAAADWFDDPVDDGNSGTEDRFAFHGEFAEDTNVWDAVQEVARMCRAEVIPVGCGYDIIIDKIWSGDSVQLFSGANMIPGSFRQDWLPIADRAVEVSMSYLDAAANYTMKPISYHDPNVGTSEKTAAIGGKGITSTAQVWRTAAFELEKNRRILSVSSFMTHVNAIVSKRGDVVNVVPPWNAAGKILSVPADNQIQIDNTQHDTSSNTVLIRRTEATTGDDAVEEHTISNINDDMITITDTWDYNPKRDDHYAFGPTAEVTKKHRIVGIVAKGSFKFKIIVAEYHANVYDHDAGAPTIPIAALVSPVSAGRQAAMNWNQLYLQRPPSEVTEYYSDNPMPFNLSWNDDTPAAGSVSWSATGAGPILLDIAGSTHEITAGNTANQFIYWDHSSPTAFQTTNTLATAVAAGMWVMCFNDSGTAFPANAGKIFHAAIMQAGTITAARAQIADATIETAKMKDLNVTTIKIEGNAVTIPVGAYTAGAIAVTTATTVQSLGITTTGQFVSLHFACQVFNTSGATSYIVTVLRDSTTIYTSGSLPIIAGSPFSSIINNAPSAAAYTYYLKVAVNAGTGSVQNRSLIAMELKK